MKTALQRVQARILAGLDGKESGPRAMRRTQVQLANVLGIKKSSLNELLHGRAKKSSQRGLLFYLDTIAKFLGVPTSTLVHRGDTRLIDLKRDEHALIAHTRGMPPELRKLMLGLSQYMSGLLPEEREARRWWNKIRRIRNARDVAYVERTIDDVLRAQRTRPGATGGRGPQHRAASKRHATALPKDAGPKEQTN